MKPLVTQEEQYQILTGKIFMHISRFLNQNLKAEHIDLTKDQWTLMAILWQKDGISQQTLADATGRDKPSITRLLNNIQKAGFIQRKPDKEDGRKKRILLTKKGKDIQEKVVAVVDNTFQTITKGLSPDEITSIRKAFKIIYQNIDAENK